jgi:hypothetical protein
MQPPFPLFSGPQATLRRPDAIVSSLTWSRGRKLLVPGPAMSRAGRAFVDTANPTAIVFHRALSVFNWCMLKYGGRTDVFRIGSGLSCARPGPPWREMVWHESQCKPQHRTYEDSAQSLLFLFLKFQVLCLRFPFPSPANKPMTSAQVPPSARVLGSLSRAKPLTLLSVPCRLLSELVDGRGQGNKEQGERVRQDY